MEVPSSIAIATRGAIVPEFTSADINDGMGVLVTTLHEDDLTPERIERFFRCLGSNASAHFFDANRYSLTEPDLRQAICEGARGVLRRYELPESILERVELGGSASLSGRGTRAIREAVPAQLLPTRFSRSEMGLNFGGNHFLEIQAVDRLCDPRVASQWGFERGQVVIMYHLGPGPFSGTLLHHYSRRRKLRSQRIPLFLASKLLFHYVQRGRRGAIADKWNLHFRQNRWTPFAPDSDEGTALRLAIAMAINFGYAYRMATVRAILDGLHEAISPAIGASLRCDVSHNGIGEEDLLSERVWMARHNACRLEPGMPTIVAGSYDVPSFVGIGGDGHGGRLHSYDHGAGNLIEQYRAAGRLEPGAGSVVRLKLSRGRNARVLARREVPCSSPEPIERLMECLERNRITRPVVRLRPIGNLKN
jgi:tRNA-splicing ligase RtcB